MRTEFLDLLACPLCGGRLALGAADAPAADGHVMEGTLPCTACGVTYPVHRGIPRLLPDAERREATRENIAARFGYEWNEFHDFDYEEEVESMATWFRPRRLEDLAGLTVL